MMIPLQLFSNYGGCIEVIPPPRNHTMPVLVSEYTSTLAQGVSRISERRRVRSAQPTDHEPLRRA
jgi:hypothetical protein